MQSFLTANLIEYPKAVMFTGLAHISHTTNYMYKPDQHTLPPGCCLLREESYLNARIFDQKVLSEVDVRQQICSSLENLKEEQELYEYLANRDHSFHCAITF